MATDYTGCTFKTITLADGDQYVLPSDANIVAISDQNNITSSCTIPPLEPFGFYTVLIAAPTDGDADNYYGSPGKFVITGYRLNGVPYSFTGQYPNNGNPNGDLAGEGCFDIEAVAVEMRKIPGVITVDTSNGLEYRENFRTNGCKCAWTFKTFGSVADNLEIATYTLAYLGHNEPNIVVQHHRLRPTSDYATYRNIPPGY
jgi:hypothetical protein